MNSADNGNGSNGKAADGDSSALQETTTDATIHIQKTTVVEEGVAITKFSIADGDGRTHLVAGDIEAAMEKLRTILELEMD